MKYRCKVTSPVGCEGEIITTVADNDGHHSYWWRANPIDPSLYPDIFELTEEEKPKRVAQAAYWDEEMKDWNLSIVLYSSKQEATDKLMGDGVTRVIWPAVFENGFLVIPEDK